MMDDLTELDRALETMWEAYPLKPSHLVISQHGRRMLVRIVYGHGGLGFARGVRGRKRAVARRKHRVILRRKA